MGASLTGRFTVNFDDQTADMLRRLAALEGRSVAAIVRELVQAVEPSLRALVDLGEAWETGPETVKAQLRAAVDQSDEQYRKPLEEALKTATEAVDAVVGAVREATPAGPADPPLVTRGSVLHQSLSEGFGSEPRKAG